MADNYGGVVFNNKWMCINDFVSAHDRRCMDVGEDSLFIFNARPRNVRIRTFKIYKMTGMTNDGKEVLEATPHRMHILTRTIYPDPGV